MASSVSSPVRPPAGSTVSIKGRITSKDDLYLDGSFIGTIEAMHSVVTLGLEAKIVGDITARSVVINGSVRGNVVAVERVALGRSSSLVGDMSTARVSMEDGAFFAGRIEMKRA